MDIKKKKSSLFFWQMSHICWRVGPTMVLVDRDSPGVIVEKASIAFMFEFIVQEIDCRYAVEY